MCCAVLKYMKCSATVMWLWWSCKAYILHSLCDIYAKNGIELLKIYNMVEHGGDGLVMTQSVRICTYFTSFDAKCDSLMLYYLIVRVNCPYIKYKCS